MSVSPRMLDWAINGVPVYIRRGPIDGKAYATTYDYSRFLPHDSPLETMRVRVPKDALRDWDAAKDPRVIKALEKYNVSCLSASHTHKRLDLLDVEPSH